MSDLNPDAPKSAAAITVKHAPVKPTLLHEPVNDYLLLETKQVEEKSKGGIYIPEQARDNPHEGSIIKCGPDVVGRYVSGDVVVYTQHTEYKLLIDGVPYTLVKEGNIILRIPQGAAANTQTTAPETP